MLAGLTTSPFSRFLAGLAHDIERRAPTIAAIDAHADGHGLLHVAAPASNEAHGIGKRERAGRDVRRVFAKAVAGDERRDERRCDSSTRQAAMLVVRIAGCVISVSARRSAGPSKQSVLSGVDARLAISEGRVGLLKDGPGLGIRFDERLPHADLLRALPGKKERNHGVRT